MNRIAREPLVHFFSLAVVVFLVHRRFAGDVHRVDVSAGTRAAVMRHFRDRTGRTPSAADQEAALRDWKREEALYREALRQQLDRDDPAIRALLIQKLRGRLALEVPKREPSAAELEQWLATHRSLYEAPRLYALEWVQFPKSVAGASELRQKFERAIAAGADLRFQGPPIFGAKLTAEELRERFGPGVPAAAVEAFPRAAWQRAESDAALLLVRVNQVEGGMPSFEELRPRLIIDWSADRLQKDVERSVDEIVARYRFDERR